MRKSKRPRIEPWGAPMLIDWAEELTLSTDARCFLEGNFQLICGQALELRNDTIFETIYYEKPYQRLYVGPWAALQYVLYFV